MSLADIGIVSVILLSMLGGLARGFFRSACTLFGLLLGLALATLYYTSIAVVILSVVRVDAVANAIGFLLIVFFVMGLATAAGSLLAKAVHGMGLGCLDKLAGAIFGFLQGVVVVTLVILVAVAFFQSNQWLAQARLPRLFFGICHFSTHLSPSGLAERVRQGLGILEEQTSRWLHPGGAGA